MQRARDVLEQLRRLAERLNFSLNSSSDSVLIRKAMLSGYFFQVARRDRSGDTYHTIKHRQLVHLHPSSCLMENKPEWVLYHELVLTSKEFIRQVSEVDPEWLLEIAPFYFSSKELDLKTGARNLKTGRPA